MRSSALFLGVLMLSACGSERLVAQFTSDVVQRRSCRVEGEREEVCERDELTQRLIVTLIEEGEDRIELYGVPRDGAFDRSIVGSRDNVGGFLFVEESGTVNSETGCTINNRIEISVAIEAGADSGVGVDVCTPLVGRETRSTTISAECDEVNEVQIPVQRILRRRWERAPGCGAE